MTYSDDFNFYELILESEGNISKEIYSNPKLASQKIFELEQDDKKLSEISDLVQRPIIISNKASIYRMYSRTAQITYYEKNHAHSLEIENGMLSCNGAYYRSKNIKKLPPKEKADKLTIVYGPDESKIVPSYTLDNIIHENEKIPLIDRRIVSRVGTSMMILTSKQIKIVDSQNKRTVHLKKDKNYAPILSYALVSIDQKTKDHTLFNLLANKNYYLVMSGLTFGLALSDYNAGHTLSGIMQTSASALSLFAYKLATKNRGPQKYYQPFIKASFIGFLEKESQI